MQNQLKFIAALSVLIGGFTLQESAAAPDTEFRLFAAEITVGPNWDGSKAPHEQAFFQEHSANLKHLRDEGHIVMGARYSDKGLIIFSTRSIEDVKVLMDQDPAMTAGTFVYEVHAFNVFYPGLLEAGKKQ